MKHLVTLLNKRRLYIFYIIVFFSSLSIIFHLNYEITTLDLFAMEYNIFFAYGLVLYKLIELPILYYILIHRHLLYIRKNKVNYEVFAKLKKQSKVLFFLIIQGNTIFGLIAYKLTVNVFFFLFFMLVALVSLILIKPNRLFL